MKKEILDKIKMLGANRVLLQVPEGLKTKVQEISKELEGLEVLISTEPCYGACDVRDHEAKQLGCDVVLHIGHSDFGVKTEVPVILEHTVAYIEAEVINKVDIGTHILYIGKIINGGILNDEEIPMTYAYYHQVKKEFHQKNAPTFIKK